VPTARAPQSARDAPIELGTRVYPAYPYLNGDPAGVQVWPAIRVLLQSAGREAQDDEISQVEPRAVNAGPVAPGALTPGAPDTPNQAHSGVLL
jgi:hypothetical protein